MNILNVFRDSELVGRLERAGANEMSFRYAASCSQPISIALPLQAEPFAPQLSRAWFANLLPEGEIRGHVAGRLGVSERNEFALLAGIGGDCAGALRLLTDADPPPPDDRLLPLSWSELEAMIARAPRPALLALVLQKGRLRLSLAGAQDKLPVRLVDGRLFLPAGDAASTHLLKIPHGSFPDLVQNELFCLALAREVGLPVPPASLAATRTPILVVDRFDRATAPDGAVRRLHQEDFCQALGLGPESKYENEGGPSLADLFAVLARASISPLPDRRDLLHWVLFNVIIGNADAHAKNLAFLHPDPGLADGPRLAPFYDLVCTAVYENLTARHAQKIGGEYRPRHIRRRHWDRFAAQVGIKPGYLRDTALALCDRVEARAATLADSLAAAHGGTATLAAVVRVIEERVGRVRDEMRAAG